MTTLTEGSKAPEIDLPTDNGGHFRLSDMKGEKVLVYFYPKDDTSGCTKESCSLSENIKSFEKLGCCIVGISKDSVKSHDKFKKKYDLQFASPRMKIPMFANAMAHGWKKACMAANIWA